MSLDLAAAEAEREKREQRRADLDARDELHGGMVSIERSLAEQEVKETRRAWSPYRSSVKRADIDAAHALDSGAQLDPRRVSIARLASDVRAAQLRYAPSFKRERAETLRADALLLIVEWSEHGGGITPKCPSCGVVDRSAAICPGCGVGKRKRALDLGGKEALPLRRVWHERVVIGETVDARGEIIEQTRDVLAPRSWHALRAAIKQAAEAPLVRAETEQQEREIPTDPVDLTDDIEQQQRDSDAPTRLPDIEAPDIIAEQLGVSLDAARAIVASAYPAASARDHAESWGISEQRVSVSISRGKKQIDKRYPEPGDLLDDLDAVAARYREQVCADAFYSIKRYASGSEDPAAQLDARRAALVWRGCFGNPSAERRALIVASMRAARKRADSARRSRADWQGFEPERVAASISRMMRAEQQRGRISASAARSSHLGSSALDPALDLRPIDRKRSTPERGAVRRLTRAERVWTYGLTARDDRARR